MRYDRAARSLVEDIEGWRDSWRRSIPFLSFPAEWSVQVIPPFGGAIARFRVMVPGQADPKSVYLDAFHILGLWDGDDPYWEVYPVDGDCGRCAMADTAELIRLIGSPA